MNIERMQKIFSIYFLFDDCILMAHYVVPIQMQSGIYHQTFNQRAINRLLKWVYYAYMLPARSGTK